MSNFKVGDKVWFGRQQGEKTLGTVMKVNRVRLKIRQDEARAAYPIGSLWGVPPSMCRHVEAHKNVTPNVEAAPKPKRTEREIMQEILGVYCGLSPENLWMDGEATATQAKRTAARLNARLRELFREMGRKVEEDEAYRFLTESRRAA